MPTGGSEFDNNPDEQTIKRVPSRPADSSPPTPSSAVPSSAGGGTGSDSGELSVEQTPIEIVPGQVVLGEYEVLKRLGRGGMGEVWLVKDVHLDVMRALKVISSLNPEARERFRREARVMAKLNHRNIITIYRAKLDLRDSAYIVMEYIPDESLEKVLKARGGPMPLDWTLMVLTQLCDALQETHDRKIIHRDLKPSNLIVLKDEAKGDLLKVLDFGIAKNSQSDEAHDPHDLKTTEGAFIGTPPYASPEQVLGRKVDGRADLYSVGVILYQFLTGRLPFQGGPQALFGATLSEQPPGFAEINPDAKISPGVERVVLRCLAKDPKDRPQSARELLKEFKAAVDAGGLGPKTTGPKKRLTDSPQRTRLIGAAVASMAVVVGLGILIFLGLLKKGGAVPPPPPPPPPPSVATHIERDGRGYDLWNHRLYLPSGYLADEKEGLDNEHPRVLLRENDGVRFRYIPGGNFRMGALGKPGGEPKDFDETNFPTHPVAVESFYMQEVEVTNREMLAFEEQRNAKANLPIPREPWRKRFDELTTDLGGSARAENHPVREVSWKLAAAYARSRGGWLPTEAQWEFAARSGVNRRVFIWDDEKDDGPAGDILANILSKSLMTTEVGIFENDKTLQGVMDLAGNVREWCRDRWLPYKEANLEDSAALPDEPKDDPELVIRGGSYNTDQLSRFVTRRGSTGQFLSSPPPRDVGFRLILRCFNP